MNRENMITDSLTDKWNKGELTTPKYIKALQEHGRSLEAELEALKQPKACDGCIWYDEEHPYYCDCLEQCSRFKHGWDKDRYEPKPNND